MSKDGNSGRFDDQRKVRESATLIGTKPASPCNRDPAAVVLDQVAESNPAGAAAGPPFVSRKPPSEPGRPKPKLVPAIDRLEMKPKLRPLSSTESASLLPRPDSNLGNYAPPRESRRTAARARLWLYVFLVATAAVLGAAIAILAAP